MKKILLGSLLVCFAFGTSWANPPKTIVIKQDSPDFYLQMKYPQGFSDKSMDEAVKKLVDDTKQANAAARAKNKEDDMPADMPGKNALYIDYKLKFQNTHALSLLFMISEDAKGAAHPSNTVKTLNFIDGQTVTLEQLFKPGSDYLTKIADISRAAILKKAISDEEWVNNGTKATPANYRNWLFTAKGIAIVFDTYQVAAYVYGPQTLEINKAELTSMLRPEVIKAVWGSQ